RTLRMPSNRNAAPWRPDGVNCADVSVPSCAPVSSFALFSPRQRACRPTGEGTQVGTSPAAASPAGASPATALSAPASEGRAPTLPHPANTRPNIQHANRRMAPAGQLAIVVPDGTASRQDITCLSGHWCHSRLLHAWKSTSGIQLHLFPSQGEFQRTL